MINPINKDIDKWVHPWERERDDWDDLYDRDERYFSILLKGVLSYLNRNIVMYNKSIPHYILHTGKSYMYIEANGYNYSWTSTSGEDMVYHTIPRCIVEMNDIAIPPEELSAPFSRGVYERRSGTTIKGYNADIQRLPIELTITLHYVLDTFNECIVLEQELIDKLVFQKYFNINYLGQLIQCSIEFPNNYAPELNKIDLSSPDPNVKNIQMQLKICSNYPVIDERTEIENTQTVNNSFINRDGLYLNLTDKDPHEADAIITDSKEYGPKYREKQIDKYR